MALIPRLEMRQSQNLVMTPQLQQAIRLLQFSNLELASFIDQEVEKNPLLEVEGAPSREAPDQAGNDSDWTDGEADGAKNASEFEAPEPAGVDVRLGEPGETKPSAGDEAPLDTNFDNVFSSNAAVDAVPGPGEYSSIWSGVRGSGGFDESDNRLEQVLGSSISLRDHLLEQLPGALKTSSQQVVGRYLIDVIDEDGYLTEDLEAIAERLGCPVELVRRTLESLQGFGPPGVFARNLRECLALQLAECDHLDPAMVAFLDNLELVANHDIAALKRVCKVDAEDLADMIAEVRSLNPKPGAAFFSEPVQAVIPDVFVRQGPDGGWLVELNSDTLPKVLVNRRYFTEISNSATREQDKAYISECLNTANWLIKALDQRAHTILKVSSEIVRQQDAFFVNGVEYLRPLNLRAIARAIDMHESTVSRVTANKYMATTRGIFELKYFFTSGVGSEHGGQQHSAEAVRHRIRMMVDNESADAVLSDDKMVNILRTSGIDIARRTVAKYRESIHIPSSVQRRRMKRMRKALRGNSGA